MPNYWLKAFGKSESPCTGWRPATRGHVDFDDKHNGAGIKVGDRLVLYAVGREGRYFAIAEVTFAARRWGDDPRYPWRCLVRPVAICPVENAPFIHPVWEPEEFVESKMQGSYVSMSTARYEEAERALHASPGCETFT